MAKIDVNFNNNVYSVDESTFAPASAELKSHLSTVMSGTGATINFGGISYNVDSEKLLAATNSFIAHLGTIHGVGSKVVINGVEYVIDSDKVANAVYQIERVLGGTKIDYVQLEPGLYQTGSNYSVMLKNLTTLQSEGIVDETGIVLQPTEMAGDYVYPPTATALPRYTKAMTGVVIPGTFEKIAEDPFDRIFEQCEQLTHIIFCEGVKYIGNSKSFQYMDNLNYISIPDSIEEIHGQFLMSAPNICYNIYNDGCYIGNENNPYLVLEKFSNEDATSCVVHPDCRLIVPYTFSADNLTEIILPEGLTFIAENSFNRVGSLTSITLPSTIKYIGYRSLSGIQNIIYNGTMEQWDAVSKKNEWNQTATEVVCSDGVVTL